MPRVTESSPLKPQIKRPVRAQGVRLELRPLSPSDWKAIDRLFGRNGACGGCWCMYWRRKSGTIWRAVKGERNRRAFRALVEGGAVRGLVAYSDGKPVGWCNFGPRSDFPRLDNSRVLRRAGDVKRWSIACFYVARQWRGRGIGQRLLEEATRESFRMGAVEVEGYPVRVWAATGRAPDAFVWTGVPAMFEAARFTPALADNGRRVIYVRRREG